MDVKAFLEHQRQEGYEPLDDEQADALLSFIESRDESDELRGSAAIAFGPTLDDIDTYGVDDSDMIEVSEDTYFRIQRTFQRLCMDADVPKLVRRRILEAAVRAPQDWHEGAIRVAYSSDDPDWKLTAVFCMVFVRGFDDEIVEAIDSEDREIRQHAVDAAGHRGVVAAWSRVAALAASPRTEKALRYAAIGAVASIRPNEAVELLAEVADSGDEDIRDAVDEALLLAGMDDSWTDDDNTEGSDDDFEEDGELTL